MADLQHLGSGKVREIYAVDADHLLIVASDRISAYDAVMPTLIPDKGRVLTGLSRHWFDMIESPHHLISVEDLPDPDPYLVGRSMLVKRADVIPMECVVRGYLYGSSWREYRDGGGPTTEHLPDGLRMADRLADPIFTPATKATDGHDENLDEAGARELVGHDVYEELRKRSLDIYSMAADYAAERGILLADTKFEFGWSNGEIILIDEVLTPDSSRYWPADEWEPGKSVPSFDKQFLRDALDEMGWDHEPPAPELDSSIVDGIRGRYVDAFERLTGRPFTEHPGVA